MTRFTVLWDEDVEAAFINAWIASNSDRRSLLTQIANWIDANLAEEPENKGVLHSELGVHVLAVPAAGTAARISVAFQVLPDDRQVRVVRLIFRGE